MAEFLCRDMAKKRGLSGRILAESAATSAEELGNPVHDGTRRRLAREHISVNGKYARQIQKSDYENYDLLIGMDQANIRNMNRMLGPDKNHKIHLLLDFTNRKGESIADPWYTGNFEETYNDIAQGLEGLFKTIL